MPGGVCSRCRESPHDPLYFLDEPDLEERNAAVDAIEVAEWMA
jgi:hypothetical protein